MRLLCLSLLLFTHFYSFAQSDSLSTYAQKVISTAKDVESKNKLVGKLDPGAMASLPIGLVKELGITKYIIAIDSGIFKPNGSYFNAYMAIDFPGTASVLAFAAKNILFNPKGVDIGPLTRLTLVGEHKIKISNNITLRLKPDGNNYVEWDCNGFKSVSLKGYFEFATDLLVPDTSATQDKKVSASFQLITNDIHNLIAAVAITPFNIKGLNGFSFSVKDALVDMSEIANAPGMAFPQGYTTTSAATSPIWTGFYIRELSIKLPPELSSGEKRVELLANTFLIDKTGISGKVGAKNILSLGEGDMSGWLFSIEQLSVNFKSNLINGAALGGKIQLPFMEKDAALIYTAEMYQNIASGNMDYSFLIQPAGNVKFPALSSTINIYNTSKLSVTNKNNRLTPVAWLNGDISVGASSANISAIKFENLIFSTEEPYIKGGIFGLTGFDVAKVGGFSSSIDSIRIVLYKQNPELDVSATIGFMDKNDFGFSASTTVRIIAKVEATPLKSSNSENISTSKKTKWSLDKVMVTEIALDVKTQPYHLKGGIAYKENDPVYGNGFFGALLFELNAKPSKFEISVKAGFGATPTIRYWYVDGAVSTTIPLGSFAEIKKLMGGMYYHMKPTTGFSAFPELLAKSNSKTPVPINYVPDATAGYGFKAGITFTTAKSEKVFNGDLLLSVNLNSSGGLSNIILDGKVVSLSTISQRLNEPVSKQKIYGAVHMLFDNANQSFHATMSTTINIPNVVTGSGQAVIHFDSKEWYVCIGKPSSPMNVKLLDLVSVQSYFMMGHNLEPMPPPPSLVASLVYGHGLNNTRDASSLQEGKGVATGVKFETGLGNTFGLKKVYISYLLYVVAGFDLMVADYGNNAKCATTNEPLGINGWYCQGQAYIGLQGAFRAHGEINFLFGRKSIDLDLFTLSAATILQAQAPKPTYLHGAIVVHINVLGVLKTDTDVEFTRGTPCSSIIN